MSIEYKIRQLAKTVYWQNIYKASKECNGIHLFDNLSNFSGLQIEILYWLEIYNSLYEGLSKYESPYLSKQVINDDIRTDAYIHYRNKKNKLEWKKNNKKESLPEVKNKCRDNLTTFTVDCRRP